MRHLLATCIVTGIFFTSWVADTQAQNPTDPNRRVLPPGITSLYANPVMSFYQRQRELREQTNLQRDINQLQKIALDNARRRIRPAAIDPATGAPVEASKTPTSSVTYKDKLPAKPDPMKPAAATKEKEKELPMPRTDGATGSREAKAPTKSKTFSNYAKMLRK